MKPLPQRIIFMAGGVFTNSWLPGITGWWKPFLQSVPQFAKAGVCAAFEWNPLRKLLID
jgi:hypothetical protein